MNPPWQLRSMVGKMPKHKHSGKRARICARSHAFRRMYWRGVVGNFHWQKKIRQILMGKNPRWSEKDIFLPMRFVATGNFVRKPYESVCLNYTEPSASISIQNRFQFVWYKAHVQITPSQCYQHRDSRVRWSPPSNDTVYNTYYSLSSVPASYLSPCVP